MQKKSNDEKRNDVLQNITLLYPVLLPTYYTLISFPKDVIIFIFFKNILAPCLYLKSWFYPSTPRKQNQYNSTPNDVSAEFGLKSEQVCFGASEVW